VVVLGRDQINLQRLEWQARALSATSTEPFKSLLQGTKGEWRQRPASHRFRNGSKAAELVDFHEDPIANALLLQTREAELVQAIDRVRSVWHYRDIYILTKIPLGFGVEIDRLVRWKNLLPDRDRLLDVLEEHGFFPNSAKDLSRLYPESFATADTAKGCVARACTNWGLDSPIDILLEKTTLKSVAVIEYKRCGKGFRWTDAIIDLERHPEPAKYLAALFDEKMDVQGIPLQSSSVKKTFKDNDDGTTEIVIEQAA